MDLIFKNPGSIYLILAGIAVVLLVEGILFYLSRILKNPEGLGEGKVLSTFSYLLSRRERVKRIVLSLIFWVVAVLLLAQPVLSSTTASRGGKNALGIFAVVDVSESMLVRANGHSRISLAKETLLSLLDAYPDLGGAFWGYTNVVQHFSTEVTQESAILRDQLRLHFDPCDTIAKGSDPGVALLAAAHVIAQYNQAHPEKPLKLLVLFSDGGTPSFEIFKVSSEQYVQEAAAILKQGGIFLYVVGVGHAEQTFVPPCPPATERYVSSALNEEILRKYARWAGGEYLHLRDPGDLLFLGEREEFLTMPRPSMEERNERSLAPYLLGAEAIILVLWFVPLERKRG